MKKRPQNTERPWKIEYKNSDGYTETLSSSFTNKERAGTRVRSLWLNFQAVADSNTKISRIENCGDTEGYDTWISSDGFHIYTVFHRNCVFYS